MTIVNFPPRDETLAFLEALDVRYRDELLRPPQPALYVDKDGLATWTQEYLRLRVNGASHESATASVFRAIDQVVHPPDPQ